MCFSVFARPHFENNEDVFIIPRTGISMTHTNFAVKNEILDSAPVAGPTIIVIVIYR